MKDAPRFWSLPKNMPNLRLRRKTRKEAGVRRDFNQHQSVIVLERSLACVRTQRADQTPLCCAQFQATALFENSAEPLFTKLLAVRESSKCDCMDFISKHDRDGI